MIGYSSAGFLIGGEDKRQARSIPVKTVRVDDVIGNEHVRLMKIDVQGGEIGVLRSAERAISEGRIDFMFVEYAGETDLLDHLLERRMHLFDSHYTLLPRKPRSRLSWKALLRGTRRADLSNWEIVGSGVMSNGARALRGWPKTISYDRDDYCRFYEEERRKVGRLFSDFVAVSPHFVETFNRAATAVAGEAI